MTWFCRILSYVIIQSDGDDHNDQALDTYHNTSNGIPSFAPINNTVAEVISAAKPLDGVNLATLVLNVLIILKISFKEVSYLNRICYLTYLDKKKEVKNHVRFFSITSNQNYILPKNKK